MFSTNWFRRIASTAVVIFVTALPGLSWSAYPGHAIRLVVPFPPGGNVDATTRSVANALAQELKVAIVIENIGGAGGSIGAANASRGQPDGYTLVSTTLLTMLANPVLIAGSTVRMEDFNLIGVVAAVPCVLEVGAKAPHGVKDFQGFLNYARSHPNTSIGHGGNGTMNHLVTLLLEREFGLQLNAVPYKGAAPALTDLLGGQVDFMVDQLSGSQAQIRGGNVIPLATTAAKRVASISKTPTFVELGKPNLDMETFTVLMSPKGTPQDVLEVLNRALSRALAHPDVQRQLQETGALTMPTNLEGAREIVSQQRTRLSPLLTPALLKPER